MNKWRLILCVAVIALLAAGCGGGPATQPVAVAPAATQPQSTGVPDVKPTGAPAGGCADIPVMANASGASTVAVAGQTTITYQSASGMDAVLAFYQAEMPKCGWTIVEKDTVIVNGISAVFSFTKGDAKASFTLTNQAGGTLVVIVAEGGGTAPQPQPTTESQSQPTAAPAGGCANIPQMADATEITNVASGGVTSITYKSASGLDAVVAFYEAEMPKCGWTYQSGDTVIVAGVNATLYFTRGNEKATVTLTSVVGVTLVVIAAEGGGAAPQPQPTTESQPQPQPTSAPAPGCPPLMADATEVTTVTSGGETTINYKSASSLDTVIAFYQAEMPKCGWTYDEGDSVIVAGVNATMNFTKDGGHALVVLTSTAGVVWVQIVAN